MDKKFKKVFTSLKSRGEAAIGTERSANATNSSNSGGDAAGLADDTPEGNIVRAIRNFCEAGTPGSADAGEEVLYLPTIVDMAESSPSAAAAAATILRKNLALTNNSRPYIQHKSIMLMRILADNPGYTFTRNTSDAKFAGAVKDLLRQGRDPNVLQILSETLDYFTREKAADEGLQVLRDVWKKHLSQAQKRGGVLQTQPWLRTDVGPQTLPAQQRSRPSLPPPHELVGRISEATTSAKLLEQLLSTTPTAEIPNNDLIKEFADRCKLAHKSIQSYIASDSPPPDVDTLTTLIETNDVLAMALDKHRKAVKEALQRGEVHAANASARLVDVGDPGAPEVLPTQLRDSVGSRGGVEGMPTATIVAEQPVTPPGKSIAHAQRRSPPEPPADGATGRGKEGEQGDVSPVTPQQSVSYRF